MALIASTGALSTISKPTFGDGLIGQAAVVAG